MSKKAIRVPPYSQPKTMVMYQCEDCGGLFFTLRFAPGAKHVCDRCMSRGNYE